MILKYLIFVYWSSSLFDGEGEVEVVTKGNFPK